MQDIGEYSYSYMIVDIDQPNNVPDHYVVCKDAVGFYITHIFYIDREISDPNKICSPLSRFSNLNIIYNY